ncbi:hypothetical protein B0T18DRAFT_409451 [Schizothecium vesticola]|uniref:Uncharacterized protein n=1 Tax=Schizothecium vesticola TaxID=314040 RepID=A0AA40K4C0_9PEZI|nr:hypothetical protein B0T18DRAFT_409451 [Schizothecium vesticola]
MIAISFSQGISWAGWTTALCLLVGAVAVWLWLHLASTRSDPALVSLAGPTSDPKRSTQKGVRLQVSPVKNRTDTLEDALEPEEGLTREGGVPLREASSHPEHGQRRKYQTEFDDKSRSTSKDIGFKVKHSQTRLARFPCPNTVCRRPRAKFGEVCSRCTQLSTAKMIQQPS